MAVLKVFREVGGRVVPTFVVNAYRLARLRQSLPRQARDLVDADRRGLPTFDCGTEAAIESAVSWICRAQDLSASRDGGVSRGFGLIDGWEPSYPETTGYILHTLLGLPQRYRSDALHERARRMADWLVGLQMASGAFAGGTVGAIPSRPVTFNTGQVLIGLARSAIEFGQRQHLDAMNRAARWLVDSQEVDGSWRRYPSPFCAPGEKVYETHTAIGLFAADRVAPNAGYGAAGLRQINWAVGLQLENGWFRQCSLDDPERPLTHGIGYTLRGILEAYRWCHDASFLRAAELTGRGVARAIDVEGWLPGRLDSRWRAAADWVCLTGSAQIAECLLLLYQETGSREFLDAGRRANKFVRRTILTDGANTDVLGGLKGSFPVYGGYMSLQFPNWAAKFCIDANCLEAELDARPVVDS